VQSGLGGFGQGAHVGGANPVANARQARGNQDSQDRHGHRDLDQVDAALPLHDPHSVVLTSQQFLPVTAAPLNSVVPCRLSWSTV
jgi:hypothetical protein